MTETREIPWRDPAEVFRLWQHDPYVAWLDSGGTVDARARYSYLAVEPYRVITAQNGVTQIDGEPVEDDPFTAVERELARYKTPAVSGPVPFMGGAIGFLGYELARYLEQLDLRHPNDLGIPDMVVGFYDTVLAFDRQDRRAWAMAGTMEQLETLLARLAQPIPAIPDSPPPLDWQPELPRAEYEARIEQVLEHIRAGDIYQANFTARHQARRPPGTEPAALYATLRRTSPAPFGAYLGCGPSLAIASASPERFLSLDTHGEVEARPIKGTRPRGRTADEDCAFYAALADSAKDQAENLMIVDLMRNDIGRVSVPGSVEVPSLCKVETFARVHHLVSAITGKLRPGIGPIGLLRATFPGGSVTGAPKIRAMEIIDQLEQSRRGLIAAASPGSASTAPWMPASSSAP